MEANKILQASLLDIIFENRNHYYGAYELRANYNKRVKQSMAIAFSTVACVLILTGFKNGKPLNLPDRVHEQVTTIVPIVDKPIIPEPTPIAKTAPVKQTKFNNIIIVPNEKVTDPVADTKTLEQTRIGSENIEGPADEGISPGESVATAATQGVLIEKAPEEEIKTRVDVQAKFEGNWLKFLERNLRADVPVENGAAAGSYRVLIEFVVDVDGSVSMIKPLTSMGYGMEEEAVRVLRKAAKWSPALQAGFPVKAYHRQMITFQISE